MTGIVEEANFKIIFDAVYFWYYVLGLEFGRHGRQNFTFSLLFQQTLYIRGFQLGFRRTQRFLEVFACFRLMFTQYFEHLGSNNIRFKGCLSQKQGWEPLLHIIKEKSNFLNGIEEKSNKISQKSLVKDGFCWCYCFASFLQLLQGFWNFDL